MWPPRSPEGGGGLLDETVGVQLILLPDFSVALNIDGNVSPMLKMRLLLQHVQ
jgi:hypothetical protein